VLSSDLPRAIESLRMLAPGREAAAERIYREAGFPALPKILVALNPPLWAALKIAKRLGWLGDASEVAESLAKARGRARAASHRLIGLAETHGSVLLVGHGMFNTLIAAELRAAGFEGPRWPTGSYWSSARYRAR
jgi:broad specificity phosphatase PhoE